jgi:hypothetical protein
MSFEQKLAAALRLLRSTGIWRSSYAPPLLRLLWKLGVRVPPPHFLRFAESFLLMGTFFGGFWGLLMWILLWSRQGASFAFAFLASAFAGGAFGFLMASYYRYGRYRHQIPLWRDFRPTDVDAFT